MSKQAELELIHESLVNGQRQQMVKQIKAYGLYDFWNDYAEFLKDLDLYPDIAYGYFRDATISYIRITNR